MTRRERGQLQRRAGLRARSSKRAAAEAVYRRRRLVFLEARPWCEAGPVLDGDGVEVCRGRATEVHHLAGRDGDRLLDESRWMACCAPCHRWVTEHPADAYRLGLAHRRHDLGHARLVVAVLVAVTVLSAFVFFAVIHAGAAG